AAVAPGAPAAAAAVAPEAPAAADPVPASSRPAAELSEPALFSLPPQEAPVSVSVQLAEEPDGQLVLDLSADSFAGA
ncbi:hypothetical protein, partial [Arthrobacter sp.]|uniref:hypothetical protein n=1 Tax=Arthrobacter sp. TaxID=1667 RepID=UPI002896BF19